MKSITRKEYMASSTDLHHEYYSQFITEATRQFVLSRIGADKIKSSKCPHLNDIIKQDHRGGWIWDYTPINIALARDLGEVAANGLPSLSTRTCVGKAFANSLR